MGRNLLSSGQLLLNILSLQFLAATLLGKERKRGRK